MKSVIFTEDSSTASKSTEGKQVRDYFQGSFLSVASLEEDLAQYGETELHILSDEYGYLLGSQPVDEIQDSSSQGTKLFKEALHSAVSEADVIVVLLTKSTFESVVVESWQTLSSQTQDGAIWCLGASKSALSAIELSRLEQKDCEIITYERVGVARIGSEAREDLLDLVKSKSSNTEEAPDKSGDVYRA